MIKIIVFASGSGSNAENIITHFSSTKTAVVTRVLCNNKNAKVFERCKRLNVPCVYFNRNDFYKSETILNILKAEADYIVLAGFLWKVPENVIEAFPKKIINVHPALLPNYGGKGMYGMNVHKAIRANNETETGITIHFVNENYDEGAIIFQAKTDVTPEDSPEDIAAKIHLLEQRYFPKVIEETIVKPNE
jgi:phosphoribosylglycinamide formyltransferase-1